MPMMVSHILLSNVVICGKYPLFRSFSKPRRVLIVDGLLSPSATIMHIANENYACLAYLGTRSLCKHPLSSGFLSYLCGGFGWLLVIL